MSTDDTYIGAEITRQLALGEVNAMQIIFKAYFPRLCLYAQSLTDNAAESEDIAQEALAQLWQERHRFAGQTEQNLLAYLFTIVKRDCYDYHKHQQVKKSRRPQIIELGATPESSVEAQMIYQEVLQMIHREIRDLPPNLSEIISLIFIEGLSTEEIADRLHITSNNVRVQKARALEKIRNALVKKHLLSPALACLIVSGFFYR